MNSLAPGRPILMTADPIGGVWTYSLELCRELGERDIPIALATMGRKLTPSERAQVRRLSRVQLFESEFKLEWMTDPWSDVDAAGDWLAALAARIAPSVIHLNQFSHGAIPWPAPCLAVGHSCVYSWFEAVRGTAPDAGWRKYRDSVARGLRGADWVTAPSRWMLGRLQQIYGAFAAAPPIYNGCDAARFAPGSKEELILTAGRLWDEAKNIAILDRVAPRLPWPIYAAGDAASPDGSAPALVNLRLLGRIEAAALARWMSRAAIFVLPVRYEPFGLAILEAGLSGCALVLGDVPSLREVWGDGALFVPADDPKAIAAALARLIGDPALRRRLGRQARRRACSFTARRMAHGYLALYRRMLDRAKPQADKRFEFAQGSLA